MKFVRYGAAFTESLGAWTDAGIVPLAPILARLGLPDLSPLLALWPEIGGLVSEAVSESETCIDPAAVRIGAPISPASQVLGVGMNFVGDDGTRSTAAPILFVKSAGAVTGPFEAIRIPDGVSVDFEGELAVVIGKGGRFIARDDASRHIAGYTVANDVTAIGWMFPGHVGDPAALPATAMQPLKGKSIETFAPLGPCIVTADEFGEPSQHRITTWVNGQQRQDASLDRLILHAEDVVARLSEFVTLRPGDVLLTGTPPGQGWLAEPSVWLGAGDVVRVAIDGIGAIENPVEVIESWGAAR